MKYNLDNLFGTQKIIPKSAVKNIETIEDIKREYEFEIHLDKFDMNTPIETRAIFIKGDRETSILKASLLKDNLPINLNNCTLTANIREGYNNIITVPVSISDVVNGKIEINLASEVVDEQGENVFEICIQKLGEITVSQQYKYTVLDSLGEGYIGGEEQLTILQSLIMQTQEKINIVNEIVEELEVTQQDIDDILGMVGGL